MKTLNKFKIFKKNVLLRVDLNVPIVNGKISDFSRIISIEPTIKNLSNNYNKIFLLSHLGRPNGENNKKLSFKIIKKYFEKNYKNNIFFSNKPFGNEIEIIKKKMKNGDICILENIRFYKEEEDNDKSFSKKISKHYDVYVNDAFSCSHRNHSSIVGIPKYLPSVAGYTLLNEIKHLEKLSKKPKKPITAIIGGAKISTKLVLINNIIKKCNNIIIGGAMANTFLLCAGFEVGKSLIEKNLISTAKKILDKADKKNINIILPIDVVCAKNINHKDKININKINKIPKNQTILDIGPKTIKKIKSSLLNSKTIIWNGPLGVFEKKPFDKGTISIAEIFKSNLHNKKIFSIAGGGDTVAAINKLKAKKYFNYVSTSGGAFLEWLEGKELPGILSLKKNNLN